MVFTNPVMVRITRKPGFIAVEDKIRKNSFQPVYPLKSHLNCLNSQIYLLCLLSKISVVVSVLFP